MEDYIQISKINDFLYSPESLYLHSIYESFNQNIYHESVQKVGKLNHNCIEDGTYSSLKKYLQGTSVYSEKYGIGGKIDLYDQERKVLIERKTRIKKIHQGHIFQLYAQMFCLEEVGYKVEKLFIHSLEDNKRYEVPLPNIENIVQFESVLARIRQFNPLYPSYIDDSTQFRCDLSIYKYLSY